MREKIPTLEEIQLLGKAEQVRVNTETLKDLALFLEGMKFGRGGSMRPLGTIVLDDLWGAIKYLRGDKKYYAERDE